jgi:Protein of unknown function, DUF547
MDNVFGLLEQSSILQNRIYSDEAKLCFFLNYYNMRLLHELLFKFLIDEKNSFPNSINKWLDFFNKNGRITLLGERFSLLEFDLIVLR